MTTLHHAEPSAAHDEPILMHHFDDVEQQHDSSVLGMWAFLATEVMFFGGLFLAYTVYRFEYWGAFAAASRELNVVLGAVNTTVLLTSSLSMALAVRAAQLRRRRDLVRYLIATMVLGTAFLGIKGYEWHHEYEKHLVPGEGFLWQGQAVGAPILPNPARPGDGNIRGVLEMFPDLMERPGAPALSERPLSALGREVQLYFVLYFCMTGLHAFHMIIGLALVGIMAWLSWRGWFSGGGVTQIEVTGLYWHFVDLVWVFLYPMLYLIHVRPEM
ncbi:MAG TPA: cytochrome c oxidase subunit 3, partial [Isosphaeraceae bacterium]